MKIVALTDSPQPSGFGRIANETFRYLANKGHQIHVCSLLWDGVFADKDMGWFNPRKHDFPFQVSGCAGRDIFGLTTNVVNLSNPDIVMTIQDFPYAQTMYFNMGIDWSKYGFVIITPIDGYPIQKQWLHTVDEADATMVISEFGVKAMADAGKKAYLCPPGVNTKEFYPAPLQEKIELKKKAGLPEDSWILGMMAMNQGRKDVPDTVEGWWQFAKNKPNVYLHLDMDKVGGWNIPEDLVETRGIPNNRVIYKEDLVKKGLDLRQRYCILDAHSVLSHREGWGLPLVEGQACKIPSLALDYCSGTEIVGGGKGYLIRCIKQDRNSGWGGAMDKYPHIPDFVSALEHIYAHPDQAKGYAEKGYEWAIARTWDKTAKSVEDVLEGVMAKRGKK